MTSIARALAAAGLLASACALSAAPVSAYEYECRDSRSGAVTDHPLSMRDAKRREDSDRRADCYRKGAPVTSSRDEYREERARQEREVESRLNQLEEENRRLRERGR